MKSSGGGCNAMQMWKCTERKEPFLELPWCPMTMICLSIVVGMVSTAANAAQLHTSRLSCRPNSFKEDLLVLEGFTVHLGFINWFPYCIMHVIYTKRRTEPQVGAEVHELQYWTYCQSVNSLAWNFDTALGRKMQMPSVHWGLDTCTNIGVYVEFCIHGCVHRH